MKRQVPLQDKIIAVKDFPQKGVIFRDITPLLLDPIYFSEAINQMRKKVKVLDIDIIAGIESRGFIFASALAYKLKKGLLPIRKNNKLLPGETVEETYALEYGEDGIKIQKNALQKGQNVLIVDDLIATGGSAQATVKLIEKTGAKVAGLLFLSELSFLQPREKLQNYKIFSLIQY